MTPTPSALGLGDEAEQLARLLLGQRGRRLVEDQHPRLGQERLGDLHHLLLGARELGDAAPDVDFETQFARTAARAPSAMARRSTNSAASRLAPEIDVLEHRASSAPARIPGRPSRCRVSPRRAPTGTRPPRRRSSEHAGGRAVDPRQDGDQRRFARAVLAEQDMDLARAAGESRRRSSALTPGNSLVIPVISTSGVAVLFHRRSRMRAGPAPARGAGPSTISSR